MLAEWDTSDWGGPAKPEPITIYCNAENAPRIRLMLYDSYVNDYGCPPDMAREIVYGPHVPPPERPDPVRVALCVDNVSGQEVIRQIRGMGRHLSDSMIILGTIGKSVGVAVQDFNHGLSDTTKDWAGLKADKILLDEARVFNEVDFRKVCMSLSDLGCPPEVPQARRRGKKKRGHNADRDRVIGGKAGYC